MTSKLLEAFQLVSVKDVLPAREVVQFNTSTPLVEAFQQLLDHHIQSAPVWCEDKRAWIGFLDLRDLVSYCVAQTESQSRGKVTELHPWLLQEWEAMAASLRKSWKGPSSSHQPNQVGLGATAIAKKEGTVESMYEVEGVGDVCTQQTSSMLKGDITIPTEEREQPVHTHISYLAARHPFRPVTPINTLADAIMKVAVRGCNRVPVTDPNDPLSISGIISQTSVIRFVDEHIESIGSIADKTVAELQLGTKPCISVKETCTALEALKLVDKRNLAGMAIVDAEDGHLIGNTSGSDLGIFLSGKVSLNLPIIDFFAQARQAIKERNDRSTTISCVETYTLRKVVAKLAKTQVHHIFIVDSTEANKRPLGVISVSDICRLLVNHQ